MRVKEFNERSPSFCTHCPHTNITAVLNTSTRLTHRIRFEDCRELPAIDEIARSPRFFPTNQNLLSPALTVVDDVINQHLAPVGQNAPCEFEYMLLKQCHNGIRSFHTEQGFHLCICVCVHLEK